VIDLRHPYTLDHSRHVSEFAVRIAERMGLPPPRVENLRKAGLLHDLGKIGIPDSVLLKPDKLTSEEYRKIQDHPVRGAGTLELSRSLSGLKLIVRHHHERVDGTGYPDGLKGHEIPLEARILAVADAYTAMATDRAYRPALTKDEIIEELINNSGTQFDAEVVKTFLEILKAEESRSAIHAG